MGLCARSCGLCHSPEDNRIKFKNDIIYLLDQLFDALPHEYRPEIFYTDTSHIYEEAEYHTPDEYFNPKMADSQIATTTTVSTTTASTATTTTKIIARPPPTKRPRTPPPRTESTKTPNNPFGIFQPTCGETPARASRFRRITNGSTARQGDHPWMVALAYKKSVGCGGTIMTPSLIITAAHCIGGDPRKGFNFFNFLIQNLFISNLILSKRFHGPRRSAQLGPLDS